MKGFCPSFLTITPHPAPAADGAPKKKKGRIPALERELPPPVKKVDDSLGFGIHVMGIGGTGSVTVVATLARAARLEGKHVIGLDQTGLAQKGGAVISDIKITHAPFKGSNKISDGRADLYLASTSSTPPTRRTSTSAIRSAPSRSCPPPRPRPVRW